MANPKWPIKSVNFRPTTGGVECTMRTHYNGVDLSVSVVRENDKKAEKEANHLLKEKVNQRKSLERRK